MVQTFPLYAPPAPVPVAPVDKAALRRRLRLAQARLTVMQWPVNPFPERLAKLATSFSGAMAFAGADLHHAWQRHRPAPPNEIATATTSATDGGDA